MRRTSARWHVGALIAVSVLMFTPYLLAGPGFFIDDWFTLRNGEFDGWLNSAGATQWSARPGAALIYALTFGLVGQHPAVYFVLAALVLTVTAVVVYRVGNRYVPREAAFGIAVTWLVLPNHTSLEMWPSALNIAVALMLLALGVERLTDRQDTAATDWAAAVLLGLSVLAYEATAPVAGVAVLAVALNRSGRRRWETLLPSAATIGAAGLWMLLNWHPEKQGLGASMDASQIVPAHFGASVFGGARLVVFAVSISVLLITGIAAYRMIARDHRGNTDWRERLIVAGWFVIVLGALPFVRYFYAPIGLGDRVTVVSGVGGAMVLIGALTFVRRWSSPAALVLTVIVFSAAIPQRASMMSGYATAADDSRRILGAVEERWPSAPDQPVIFGPTPIVERNIVTFYEMTIPLQLLYGERVDARLHFDPTEFETAPPSRRVDLRKLSKLDDGRLGSV